MSKEMKVTDKRMFTAEGELREEFRHLEEEGGQSTGSEAGSGGSSDDQPAADEAPPAAATRPEERAAPAEAPAAPAESALPSPPPIEIPDAAPGLGTPTFLDLVGILAEPVALYMGDMELPDGQSAENLDAARMHIDLLDVLRQKTVHNLSAQESAVLEDVLYRLKMRYVQKRG